MSHDFKVIMVCASLNPALEIHQVPRKVVSHGGTCLGLPSLLSSLLLPFLLLLSLIPSFSSLPFFSFYLRNENMLWKSSFAKQKETLKFYINVNSRSVKKYTTAHFSSLKCSPSLALNL